MSILSFLLVFFLSWWLVWMMALPFGVRSRFDENDSSAVENAKGSDPGAPINPNLLKKLALTTLVTFVFVGIFWLLFEMGVITWLSLQAMDGVSNLVDNS